MENTKEYIDNIKKDFEIIQTAEDLAALLTKVYQKINPESVTPIFARSLTYYGNYKLAENRYRIFMIPKRSGGERIIYAPMPTLKKIQRALAELFQILYTPPSSCVGFVKQKCIKEGAQMHVGMRYVYNIDLKDYFPSIPLYRVKKCFSLPPFNMIGEKRERLAYLIANLCCYSPDTSSRAFLPQGAPTSPVLSNIVSATLDRRLNGVAKRYGLKYSRYADDITFSALENKFTATSGCVKEINRIIASQHFLINQQKVHLSGKAFRQMVTGIVVNTKLNVPQTYVRELRSWLYLWKRYGYKAANNIFQERNSSYNKAVPELYIVLKGKIAYLKMIKGDSDSVYLSLNRRFLKLMKRLERPTVHHYPKDLSALLREMFSSEHNSLKYTTHNWDKGEMDYLSQMEAFRKQFERYTPALRKLDKKLYAKIRAFIIVENENGKKEHFQKEKGEAAYWWGKYRLCLGWRSKELEKWALENPTCSPFAYPLPPSFPKVEDKTLRTFEDIVGIFKQEVECRKENKQLKRMLTECKRELMNKKFDAKLDCDNEIGFYTNIERLQSVFDRIIKSIIQYQGHSRKVNIEVKEEVDRVEIWFIHVDSVTSLKVDELKSMRKGDLNAIYEKLQSIADWKVYLKLLDDTCWQCNFLPVVADTFQPADSCAGFTHVLTLYK